MAVTDKTIEGRNRPAVESTDFALDDLCTPPAVASLLGVSAPTVYAAIRRAPPRRLAHLRTPGGQIRVRRRDVLAYCHATGVKVPEGLVPHPPSVVVIHPDHRISNRLRLILAERQCQVSVFKDHIDGLLNVGQLRPALVIISESCGRALVARLCAAIADQPHVGYMTIVLLVDREPKRWQGGPVPQPLEVSEPVHAERTDVGEMIDTLLGLA